MNAGAAHPTSIDPRPGKYVTYLVIVALAGWALASYDINLLVLALPDVAKSLNVSESGLGLLGFVVYGAQLLITLCVGFAMDRFGRRRVWMVCLSGSAIFTGLTYFVQSFWQLALIRALASGFAYSELAVSITIVNEQLPAMRRGLLYSIVQGGWPLGVFLASGVYLAFGRLGWRFVFLLGVLPIVAVIAGRSFVREPERFERLQGVKSETTLRTLFAQPGPIRKQLTLLSVTWLFYGASCVATNFYIAYWLTKYKGFTDTSVSTLLLVCGGIGFFFYILGGWLGERWGRREVIIGTGAMVAPLTILLLITEQRWVLVVVYFLLYQATNGTWSGAGYAYQAESFPTRVRGTAIGFLGAVQVAGFVVGSLLWTGLSTFARPSVTWLVVATAMSLGMWTTVLLRRIPPGHDLDAVTPERLVG